MKTIEILNQQVRISFNMKVQLTYEEIADRTFSLTDLSQTKYRLTLYYATIIANNPDTTIQFDDLLADNSLDTIKALDEAVGEAMKEWYHIPEVAEEPTKEEENSEKKEGN